MIFQKNVFVKKLMFFFEMRQFKWFLTVFSNNLIDSVMFACIRSFCSCMAFWTMTGLIFSKDRAISYMVKFRSFGLVEFLSDNILTLS